jgi:hypothetical protein
MTEPRTKAGRALLDDLWAKRQPTLEAKLVMDIRDRILAIEAEADTLGAAISDPNNPLLAEAIKSLAVKVDWDGRSYRLPPEATAVQLRAALLAAHGKGEALTEIRNSQAAIDRETGKRLSYDD